MCRGMKQARAVGDWDAKLGGREALPIAAAHTTIPDTARPPTTFASMNGVQMPKYTEFNICYCPPPPVVAQHYISDGLDASCTRGLALRPSSPRMFVRLIAVSSM
jgi:hypothetical protein